MTAKRYRFEGHFTHSSQTPKGTPHYLFGTMEEFFRWKENNKERFERWQKELKTGTTTRVIITRTPVNERNTATGEPEIIFQLPPDPDDPKT